MQRIRCCVAGLGILALGAGGLGAQPVFYNGAARVEARESTSIQIAMAAVAEADKRLQQNLGARPPRCYLVSDNLGQSEAVSAALNRLLTNAPWAGLANNWGDYLPIDRDTLGQAETKGRGLVITAVCGEVDVELQMVEGLTKKEVSYDLPKEEWRRRWEEQAPAHASKGEELVSKFHFPKEAGVTTVLLVTGTMHTPRQEYVFAGVRRALPAGVKLIGGSGADFSTVYYGGHRFENALYGVRLSGKFQAAVTGSKGGGDLVQTALPKHLQTLKRQLGGAEPTAMFYFGCAGWRTALATQQGVLQQELPKELGIYGQFCGGEMGQLEGTTDLVADTDLGVLLLMAPLKSPKP